MLSSKLSLAVLSFAVANTTSILSSAASAVDSPAQPVVFISQPNQSELVSATQATKLEQWEKQLHERLGVKTEALRASATACTTISLGRADDCGQD